MAHRVSPRRLFASVVVSLALALSGGVAPAEAAGSGVLRVTIKTPSGVPGTVYFTKSSLRIVASKPPTGTTRTVKYRAGSGTWTTMPRQIVANNRIYLGKASVAKPVVRTNRTTNVSVTFKPANTARGLRVAQLPTQSTIKLAFTRPAGVSVKMRRAAGRVAPRSYASGTAVPVVDSTATSAGLSAGSTYSYSLFTKIGTKWIGPLSLTATTAPPNNPGVATAAFISQPDTVLVPSSTAAGAVPINSRDVVRVPVPSGTVPTIGQALVVPKTALLPGGFIGRVISIAADGKTVELKSAPLDEAFDYLDVHVPSLAGISAKVATSRSAAAEGQDEPTCSPGGSLGFTFNPSLSHDGYFDLHLNTGIFGLPKGAKIDVRSALTFTAAVDVELEEAYSCALALADLIVTFNAGPVPMMLKYDSSAALEATGQVKFTNAGWQITGGFEAHAHFGKGDGWDGNDVSGELIKSASALTPQFEEANASVGAKVEGSLIFGPGLGNIEVGAIAGIRGQLTPLDAKFSLTSTGPTDTCLTAEAGGSAGLSLSAKAWIGSFDVSAEWEIPHMNTDWSYGGPWTLPEDCGTGSGAVWSGVIRWDVQYREDNWPKDARLETVQKWTKDGHYFTEIGPQVAGDCPTWYTHGGNGFDVSTPYQEVIDGGYVSNPAWVDGGWSSASRYAEGSGLGFQVTGWGTSWYCNSPDTEDAPIRVSAWSYNGDPQNSWPWTPYGVAADLVGRAGSTAPANGTMAFDETMPVPSGYSGTVRLRVNLTSLADLNSDGVPDADQ